MRNKAAVVGRTSEANQMMQTTTTSSYSLEQDVPGARVPTAAAATVRLTRCINQAQECTTNTPSSAFRIESFRMESGEGRWRNEVVDYKSALLVQRPPLVCVQGVH